MVADWFDKPSPPSVTTNVTPRIPPCVGHASQDLDERPGDYLEERSAPSHYPEPATADLVIMWRRGPKVVMSVTSDGKVHDFHLPPARLVYLLREVAEQLAENSILK